jgi:16S rRNA (cytosine967-C5)-methyltransferase
VNSLASGGPKEPPGGEGKRTERRIRRRLDGAAEACAAWRALGHPPLERFLSAWTVDRAAMGAQDRRFLARVLFRVAREQEALLRGAHPRAPRLPDDPLVLAAGAFGMLEAEEPTIPAATLRAVLEGILEALPDRPWGRLPDAWREALVRAHGAGEAEALARVLNRPAGHYDLRVNRARLARDQALAILAGDGFPAEPVPHAPDGLRLPAGRDVRSHPLYRRGLVEIQDESSQLVALLAVPSEGGRVLDFCAGAGGKTLALAASLGRRGRLTAYDPDRARLAELRRRVRRAGIPPGRVRIVDAPPSEDESYDVVLVDAPCSGSGTLRRAPHLLWRPLDLEGEAVRQRAILRRAAAHVRPGGLLVYATCSVFAEENEGVSDAWGRESAGWRACDLRGRLEEQGVRHPEILVFRGALRLLPHRHGTDGMEARAWIRTDG